MFLKCFKSRLCLYINLDFLLFHFTSAKIYISQIYLLNIKSHTLNNNNQFVSEKIESRLCSNINLNFLQILFMAAKINILQIYL